MAVTQLAIYNDALRLVGAERLSAIDEDREVRYKLDEVWDLGAAEHCLRLVKPVFARKTAASTTATTTATHALQYVHDLPVDYLAMVEVFGDNTLDAKVTRRLIEDDKLYSAKATIYLRYVSDFSADLTAWSTDFVRVVSAYIATQLAPRIAPDMVEALDANLDKLVEASLALSDMDESAFRAPSTNTQITSDWLPIYNNALQILGLPKLITVNDDRYERVLLDTARESGLVANLIADYPWNWTRKTVFVEYNSHLEPAWGFEYVCEKPTELVRLDGVFRDEYQRTPLKHYRDEGRYIYSSYQSLYLTYIPNTAIESPGSWEPHISRYIAALLADAVKDDQRLALSEGQIGRIMYTLNERKQTAENRDFMQAPPQIIHTGSWVRARRYQTGENG